MINQRNDAQGWRKQSRRRVGVCVCVTQTQAAHLWVKQSKGSVELRQTVVNRELGLGLTVLWVFFRFNSTIIGTIGTIIRKQTLGYP